MSRIIRPIHVSFERLSPQEYFFKAKKGTNVDFCILSPGPIFWEIFFKDMRSINHGFFKDTFSRTNIFKDTCSSTSSPQYVCIFKATSSRTCAWTLKENTLSRLIKGANVDFGRPFLRACSLQNLDMLKDTCSRICSLQNLWIYADSFFKD